MKDTYAYLADGDGGLRIIDVSNPIAPVMAGSYDTVWTDNVAVGSNAIFMDDADGNLLIVRSTLGSTG